MSVNTNYYDYSNVLFNNTSKTNSTDNMYNLLSQSQSASMASYRTNTAENTLPEKTKTFLSEAKTASEDLKSTLNSLIGKTKTGSTTFDEKTAVSSDTEYLAIKSVAAQKTELKDKQVDIEQVATAQKNEGTALKAKEKALSAGYQTFEVNVDGKKTALSFRVSATDTNETAQKKMADAINSRNLGISAKVTTETKDGVTTSKLALESSKTGINKAGSDNFSIRDFGGSTAVSSFGVAEVDQKAQNAKFRVNGGDLKESKSNDVDLGNGITATLKKATTNDVKVSMGKDTVSSQNNVRQMVNGFNELLDAAKENKSDRRTTRLVTELEGLASSYGMSLDRIGISENKDGYLKIDEKKMKAAAESGELEKFFTGNGKDSSYGFANRLSRTAENVSKNTTDYASNQNIQSNSYFTPKQTQQYNQLMNTGLLFNTLL